jgi:hypothetical protein
MYTNETRVLHPSVLKWFGIGLFFFVISFFMIADGRTVGWFCLVVFGLGLVIVGISVLPNASYLRLTPEGFTVCSLYRAHTLRWKDVAGFAVGGLPLNKMVMFNFSSSYQKPGGTIRAINVGLAGYEGGLPDSYGLSHEALADLLNQYKAASVDG